MVVNLDKSKQILDCWPHNGIPSGLGWPGLAQPDLQTGALLTYFSYFFVVAMTVRVIDKLLNCLVVFVTWCNNLLHL